MRVAFLTQDLALSGGVGVVVEHASHLASDHGFDVDLVLTRPTDRAWRFRGLEGLRVLGLPDARALTYDVAVATWWETTQHLFELDAARHATFVQSLEDRFYEDGDPRRLAAILAQDLPTRFITEARWIADHLEALHPGERVLLVRNGIAKATFPLRAGVPHDAGAPLRILIEGSAQVPLKGVRDAVDATARMREPRHVTHVTPDGVGAPGVDEVVGPVPHRDMAGLYAHADVLLKLSRVEGMFGPPLEAFHRGATCVVTPVTGHEEYVEHGENGLLVGWDDPAGTAATLDLLARDRALLHRLRLGALQTARAWPDWRQQGQVMAAALRLIRREPPPAATTAAARLATDAGALLALSQRQFADLEGASEKVAEIQRARAYRIAVGVRAAKQRVTGAPRGLARRLRGG